MQKTCVLSLCWEDPLEEGMATHSNVLAWRIPMDRGAWQAAVHGVTKSRTHTHTHTNVLFNTGGWNAKIRIWEIRGVASKFGLGVQNEAGQRLTEFCEENALVIANTLLQQHKRRLYTWTSPDGQHRNQIDYILCSQRWRSSIQSAKTRPGADCGSDHELLIANSDLNWRK